MTNSVKFNPKRILCPVDYSEPSALALKYAVAGARVFDAHLTVLHAVQIEPPPYFTKSETDQLLDQLRQATEYARADLTAFITRVLGSDPKLLNIKTELSDALPANAILETIKSDQADLVIMGTHGRSPAKRFLLGSVTDEGTTTLACASIYRTPGTTRPNKRGRSECPACSKTNPLPS